MSLLHPNKSKKGKKPAQSKVVDTQADGTPIYGFEKDPASEKTTEKIQDDYSNHPKFHKFKKGT